MSKQSLYPNNPQPTGVYINWTMVLLLMALLSSMIVLIIMQGITIYSFMRGV